MHQASGHLVYAIALALVVCACGGSASDDSARPGDSGAIDQMSSDSMTADTPMGDGSTFDISSPLDTGSDGCTEENRDIYVISNLSNLYRFSPATKTYTHIGKVNCGTDSGVFSMAVDRSGTAWVLFQADNTIARVSTKDASCAMTSYATCQSGICYFGMAFSSDSVGAKTETLYVDGPVSYSSTDALLSKIDTKALTLSTIGLWDPKHMLVELTGTGSGELYGFGQDSTVSRLDRVTAKILETKPVPGFSIGGGYAFAQWGGDFWLFTRGPGGTARVAQFSWASGTVVSTTDRTLADNSAIVGAGVSTCAPFAPK